MPRAGQRSPTFVLSSSGALPSPDISESAKPMAPSPPDSTPDRSHVLHGGFIGGTGSSGGDDDDVPPPRRDSSATANGGDDVDGHAEHGRRKRRRIPVACSWCRARKSRVSFDVYRAFLGTCLFQGCQHDHNQGLTVSFLFLGMGRVV